MCGAIGASFYTLERREKETRWGNFITKRHFFIKVYFLQCGTAGWIITLSR